MGMLDRKGWENREKLAKIRKCNALDQEMHRALTSESSIPDALGVMYFDHFTRRPYSVCRRWM